MIRTRVGYAGGTTPRPTYHSLGDHTETVQIDFDPNVITYDELLEVFWKSHEPTIRSWSRQYISIILYHTPEQKQQAEASLRRYEVRLGRRITTEVAPAKEFTRAEDYHQKHALRRFRDILHEFERLYPSSDQFTDSTAVTRANGYLGGEGRYEELEAEADQLGLSGPARRELLETVRRRSRSAACPVPG